MGKAKYGKGIIKLIADKEFQGNVSAAKRALMRLATNVLKRVIREAGIDFDALPKEQKVVVWIGSTSIALPKFWELVAEKKRVPTEAEVEEVFRKLIPKIKEIYEKVRTLRIFA